MQADASPVATVASNSGLGSLYDIIVSGGPIMWPIGLCSVVALGVIVDRWIRLRPHYLGTAAFGQEVVGALRASGPADALVLCENKPTPLARIFAAALKNSDAPPAQMEKVVEDAGAREVRNLSLTLRPLIVIATIAPLLGLLGTVWGMIIGFSNIAYREALGRPELLASAISQALVTTAAGLVVAIPVQAVYYVYRHRIDRFVKLTEKVYDDFSASLKARMRDYAHS